MLDSMLVMSSGGGSSKDIYYSGWTRSAVHLTVCNGELVCNSQGNGYTLPVNYSDDNLSITSVANTNNYTYTFKKACEVTTVTGTSGTESTTTYSANSSTVVNEDSTALIIKF